MYIGICIIKIEIDTIMQLKNIFCILQFKEPVNLKHNNNYGYIDVKVHIEEIIPITVKVSDAY